MTQIADWVHVFAASLLTSRFIAGSFMFSYFFFLWCTVHEPVQCKLFSLCRKKVQIKEKYIKCVRFNSWLDFANAENGQMLLFL